MCRAILFLFLVKKSFSSPLQVAELPKTDALVKYRRTENVTFCNIVFLHGRFVVFEVLDVGAMNGEVVKGPFYSIVRTVLKSFIADEALCCPAFRSVASCVPSWKPNTVWACQTCNNYQNNKNWENTYLKGLMVFFMELTYCFLPTSWTCGRAVRGEWSVVVHCRLSLWCYCLQNHSGLNDIFLCWHQLKVLASYLCVCVCKCGCNVKFGGGGFFPCMWGFWENVWQSIPCLCFLLLF